MSPEIDSGRYDALNHGYDQSMRDVASHVARSAQLVHESRERLRRGEALLNDRSLAQSMRQVSTCIDDTQQRLRASESKLRRSENSLRYEPLGPKRSTPANVRCQDLSADQHKSTPIAPPSL